MISGNQIHAHTWYTYILYIHIEIQVNLFRENIVLFLSMKKNNQSSLRPIANLWWFNYIIHIFIAILSHSGDHLNQ